ncbi:hypothetical protein KKE54_00170 [bacterium]|nr:hypothetical protein [bacterium]
MSEPRLQDISDYNKLSGEKRRIVWAVVIAGLIIGSIYLAAKSYYVPDDSIETHDAIGKVPSVK